MGRAGDRALRSAHERLRAAPGCLPGRLGVLAVFLALASAIGYGGSDFAAGLASRQASVIRVTIVAELASLLMMLLFVPWVSSQAPSAASYGWSAAAGLGGMIGALALYLGFRHAAFSVAGPLSAVASAAFSVLAGLAFGEHPGGLAIAGIALAIPAIVAVSVSPASPGGGAGQAAGGEGAGGEGEARHRDAGPIASRPHILGVLYGLAAGAGFAVLFIGLDRAGSGGSDLWPAVISQATALAVVCAAGAARGQLGLPSARASWLGAVAGVTGGIGTICFYVATHQGLLAVTAVITSLYPAGTVLLAQVLLRERLTPMHVVGLGMAGASVTLIAVAGAG
jgi:drug/metabolite transporter (DMT)-like permease